MTITGPRRTIMDRNGTFNPQLNVTKPQIELIAFILGFKNNSFLSSERTRKPRNANLPKTQKFLKIQNTKFTLLYSKNSLFYSKSNPFLNFCSVGIKHFLFFRSKIALLAAKSISWVIFKRFYVENGYLHEFG